MLRNERNIEIFNDTLKQSAEKYPVNIKQNVRYYSEGNFPVAEPMTNVFTPIFMVQGGTVSTGYANADNMQVAILNFADAIYAGGLVWIGENTQEENICRCSNLYQVLGDEESDKQYYIPNHHETLRSGRDIYLDNIIYARDITVFKNDITYENIEPKKLDVITCPAPSDYMPMNEALPVYIRRIERILMSAVDNGAECIVLGAWGCGAFGQDPKLVAQAFARAINSYGGHFKRIIFAIRPTYDGEKSEMYKIFKDTLTEWCKTEVIE